jgi:hypothetical protein
MNLSKPSCTRSSITENNMVGNRNTNLKANSKNNPMLNNLNLVNTVLIRTFETTVGNNLKLTLTTQSKDLFEPYEIIKVSLFYHEENVKENLKEEKGKKLNVITFGNILNINCLEARVEQDPNIVQTFESSLEFKTLEQIKTFLKSPYVIGVDSKGNLYDINLNILEVEEVLNLQNSFIKKEEEKEEKVLISIPKQFN